MFKLLTLCAIELRYQYRFNQGFNEATAFKGLR